MAELYSLRKKLTAVKVLITRSSRVLQALIEAPSPVMSGLVMGVEDFDTRLASLDAVQLQIDLELVEEIEAEQEEAEAHKRVARSIRV